MTRPAPESIPFHRPHLGEAEVEAAAAVIRSGWLTTGKATERLEAAAAAYLETPSTVATNSGTSALSLLLLGLGVGPGDEVITSPYTFVATAQCIQALGAEAVFADIDPSTGNLDPRAVEEALTPKTRGIVVVHVGGHPAPMRELAALKSKRNLFLVEDAAHAFETKTDLGSPGRHSDGAAFSFYASKNLTCGEGGLVATPDAAFMDSLRSLRNHGLDRDSWQRDGRSRPWSYDIRQHGLKVNPSDVLSAIGEVQIGKVDAMYARRVELVARYRELLCDVDELILPAEPEEGRHAWHLFAPRLEPAMNEAARDGLLLAMGRRGIQTSVHFRPLHEMSVWQEADPSASFPRAEDRSRRCFSLPLYPDLSAEDVRRVVDALRASLAEIRAKHRS